MVNSRNEFSDIDFSFIFSMTQNTIENIRNLVAAQVINLYRYFSFIFQTINKIFKTFSNSRRSGLLNRHQQSLFKVPRTKIRVSMNRIYLLQLFFQFSLISLDSSIFFRILIPTPPQDKSPFKETILPLTFIVA